MFGRFKGDTVARLTTEYHNLMEAEVELLDRIEDRAGIVDRRLALLEEERIALGDLKAALAGIDA